MAGLPAIGCAAIVTEIFSFAMPTIRPIVLPCADEAAVTSDPVQTSGRVPLVNWQRTIGFAVAVAPEEVSRLSEPTHER